MTDALAARLARAKNRKPVAADLRIPARPAGVPLELSPAQRQLWFLHQWAPDSPAYHVPVAWRLRGPLDVQRLRAALTTVITRHELLRTRYLAAEGEPVAVVDPPAEPSLPVLPATDAGPRLAALARRPFALDRDWPVRAELLRISPDEHVLLLTFHHIAMDGWSAGLLAAELAAGYTGEAMPVPVQYADVTHHRRDRNHERELPYWLDRLADLPELAELPADRPRSHQPSDAGATHSFELDTELTEALRALGAAERASGFMLTLAGFAALCSRYTGARDLVVGTPVGGRDGHPGLDEVIGCFVNTLPLRIRFPSGVTGRELLRRVRDDVLADTEHASLPYPTLVEALPRRGELYQLQFVATHVPRHSLSLPGLTVTEIPVDLGAAKFDLSLAVADLGGPTIGATVTYRTELFDEATIARFAGHYVRLLAGLVADPDTAVADLPLLGEEEARGLLLPPARPVTGHRGRTVLDDFDAWVRRAPSRPAVVAADGTLRYAELDEASRRIAACLVAAGVRPGEPVAISAERSIRFLIGMLGVLRAGAAYLPIEPDQPPARRAAMLAEAGVRLCVEDLDPAGGVTGTALPSVGPEDLAYVLSTSGSTGAPKMVAVEHRNLSAYLDSMADRLAPPPGASFALCSTLAADLGHTMLYGALRTGGTVHLIDAETAADPERFAARMAARPVDYLKLVPSHLAALLDAATADLLPLRCLVLGGEAMSWELVERIHALRPGLRVLNHYGPTETTVGVLTYDVPVSGPQPPVVPLGRPLPHVAARVLDDRLNPVPVGVPGELCIGGAGVARGYLNQPELTAARFVDVGGERLYRTGDRARWRPDGTLEFLGRADRQVKIRGYRVEPGEVETVLRGHPEIRDTAVLAVDGRLVAYVVPACAGSGTAAPAGAGGGEPALPHGLADWLAGRLPAHMVPAVLVPLTALPLTANGKVDRAALPRVAVRHSASREPAGPMERAVAAVFGELLGVNPVGADDDFFALGGHSLLATRAVSRLRRDLGLSFPLPALFDHPTVAGLARYLATVDPPVPGSGPDAPAVLSGTDRAGGPPVLSAAQRRLWFLDQATPGGPAYNLPYALRITGKLDVTALRAALTGIVARHDALRTVFPSVDGVPRARLLPPYQVELPVSDVTGQAEIRREIDEEFRHGFDLASGPLLRARLLRSGAEEHVLLLTFHHIAFDGWSYGVFVDELAAGYAGRTVPPPPVSHADYARWQHDLDHSDDVRYWRHELDGAPGGLELPADRPRPATPSYRGGAIPVTIPPGTAGRLNALGRERGATPFMTLLAGYQLLLARYGGVRDLVVGSPVAGRSRPELERLLGCFVNMLPLRGRIDPDLGFRAHLDRAKDSVLAALDHAELPFERLVGELQVSRDPSRHPVFSTMFALQNTPRPAQEPPGLRLTPLDGPTGVAKYDLSLILTEEDGGYRGWLEYSSDLFDRETVERLAGHLGILLAAIADDPDTAVGDLPLTGPAERHRLLVGWNDTAAPYPAETVPELVALRAAATPDAVAVADDSTALSYRELDRRANRLAHRLHELGVGPGGLVAVAVERSVSLPIALLAVLRAGAAYLPLDASHPARRLAFTLSDSGASVLLTDAAVEIPFEGPRLHPADPCGGLPDSSPAIRVDPGDRAYLIYTSGSTGRPKGVAVPHRALTNFLAAMAREPGLAAGDTLLAVTTPSFDIAGLELWLPLTVGACVVIASRETTMDGSALARRIAETDTTCLQATPVTWRLLLDAGWPGDPGLTALCGGEPLPVELAAALAGKVKALWNLYGPTEATIWATAKRIEPGRGEITIGRPIANLKAYVLDERRHPVPAGVAGELYLGGAGLALGYHDRPELTAERFVTFAGEPVYRTGDLARWRPDGELVLLGRIDGQVKLRGYRIEVGEIEAVLAEHPAVRRAAVELRPDAAGEPRLVGYLVEVEAEDPGGERESPAGTADPGLDPGALRGWLADRLPPYMIPSVFVPLAELPVTPNGKLDRRALPDPAPAAPVSVSLDDPVEARIAAVFAELLECSGVGPDDDFFALGGDSMRAVRAVRMIDPSLSVLELFTHPTPRGLAGRVAGPDDGTRLLHHLVRGSERTVVAVPFGGAGAVVFAELAKRMPKGWGLCAVQPPGRDPARPGEPGVPLPELADRIAAELLAEPTGTAGVGGPIVLYGHCVGAALATAIAQRLAEAGRPAEALVVGAAFPIARFPGVLGVLSRFAPDQRLSDRGVTDGLRALGGLDEELPDAERRMLAAAVRHDAAQAEDFYAAPPRPVDAPVLVVVGENDRITEFHGERAAEWAAYGTTVDVAVLPDAGHFFQGDPGLAGVLADRAGQAPVRPPEVPPKARLGAFLTVTAGQLVSLIGTGLSTFALGVWAYQTTGAVATMALIASFTLLPQILVAPLAGAVADRYDRRKVMIGCDAAALAGSAVAAALLLNGTLAIGHLYALVTVHAIASVFRQPAYQAAVAQLVPKRYLGHANGVVGLGSATGALLAQVAGGALMVAVGLTGALWLDVVTFAVALGTLVVTRFPKLGFTRRDEPLIAEIVAGWRYLTGHRGMVAVVVFFAVGNALSGVVLVLVTPLVLAFGSPAALGGVLAAQGLGLLAGSVVMTVWGGTRRRVTGMIGFVGLFAVSAIVIGLRPITMFPALGMFGVGVAASMINAHWLALVQVRVRLELQGRVLATAQMLARVITPLGYLATGTLVDRLFEPAAADPGFLGGLIGTGHGRGMAAVVILAGLAVAGWTIACSRYRPLRELEDDGADSSR
ncbi:amino acid adenylation domain-containing protein [Streptosporangium sp. NPDC000396]|uniref:non-ribosomal peptide synthetase/MFS transporter n=1 Tax=Streptosporangium sp. NPDC000396 TaxID=3366185 RepID=UPI0036C9897E